MNSFTSVIFIITILNNIIDFLSDNKIYTQSNPEWSSYENNLIITLSLENEDGSKIGVLQIELNESGWKILDWKDPSAEYMVLGTKFYEAIHTFQVKDKIEEIIKEVIK